METNRIIGIIIVLMLLFGIIGAVAHNFKVSAEKEKIQSETFSLKSSDLNSSVKKVNLNIEQDQGGVDLSFSDDKSNVYQIESKGENLTTDVTYKQNGDTLDVYIKSGEAQNQIVLSDEYTYNINSNIVMGGINANLSGAKIEEFTNKITLGGANLILENAKISKLNINITTGGLNLVGNPIGKCDIDSNIGIGGINANMDDEALSSASDVNLGGVYAGGVDYEEDTSNITYKGDAYDSSKNKINLKSDIELGGLSIGNPFNK